MGKGLLSKCNEIVKQNENEIAQRLIHYAFYAQTHGLINFFYHKPYKDEPIERIYNIFEQFSQVMPNEYYSLFKQIKQTGHLSQVISDGIEASLFMTNKFYTAHHLKKTYNGQGYTINVPEAQEFLSSKSYTEVEDFATLNNNTIELNEVHKVEIPKTNKEKKFQYIA